MRRVHFLALALAGAILSASGCAVTRDRGAGAVNELIQARGAPAAKGFERTAAPATPIATPLAARQAVELAFERSPRVRELWAELGISTADVIAARAVPDLTLGYARLSPEGGGGAQVTRRASLGFTDLLLLPARSRFAGASFEIARSRVAAQLLELENDVQAAWYEYVAAAQSAEIAELAARAAEASAGYARRLDAAGNIQPRSLSLELADAASGRIDAARARAAALRARADLAALVGLSTREDWRVPARLPAPPAADASPGDLTERALETRLDVAAARREVAAFESALTATKVWRWIGDFELGYERETETDGVRLRGPTLALKLPLFNFNRDGVLRAEASLEAARARRDALELAVRNDLALALDRMTTAREIADVYRTALVPQREAATAHTLAEANYMLSGAFELLATRREQFTAYGEYIEAVRDYWLARIDLERALGAHLADDVTTATLDLGLTGESK
jgi:cobalt-zinc-cadmium efflux system outer membrane protein